MNNSNSYSEWWLPIKEAYFGLSLKSLRVTCPRCHEKGLVTTRWKKGPALKPLYILHIKWRRVRRVCELNQKQADNIRGKVSVLESDVKQLLATRKSFVLFSGGYDSLATLFYLRNVSKNVGGDLTAIYVDTTAGLPANKSYVKKVCKYLDVRLKVVKPEVDYFTLAREWGIPSFGYRWCCRELKIKPIEKYLSGIKESKVVFDGIRAAESNIRKQYIPIWFHPSFKCLSVSPIFYWPNDRVISFVNSNGLPKTFLHSLGTSTECWCGAYKTEDDFKKLYDLDREMFQKLLQLEEKVKTGYTFIYKNGKRKSLKSVKKEILKERGRSKRGK